jgi:6-phosphogluconolactonase
VVVADASELAESAAERISVLLVAALAERPRASVALSGGTTPLPAYRSLATRSRGLRWDRIDLYFADERCIAPDDEQSNYHQVSLSLLGPLRPQAPLVFRMRGELADPAAAAREYEAELPPRLDLIVLGIGDDGHTASLFPGAPALAERERRVLAVVDSPKPPPRRLTLAPRAIREARELIVLAAGPSKAEAVAAARREATDPVVCPAGLARRGTWILDRAAAARIGQEETGSGRASDGSSRHVR